MKIVTFLAVVLLSVQVQCSLRIIGGFTRAYHITNEGNGYYDSSSYTTYHDWGTDGGSNYMYFGKTYCIVPYTYEHNGHTHTSNERRYCETFLYLTHSSNEEYFDLRGSYLVVKDSSRTYEDEIRYRTGDITNADPPMIDQVVYQGEAWSRKFNDWGYAYLHFILEPTTRAPIIDTYSWQTMRTSNPSLYKHSEIFPQGDRLSTSVKHVISDFRSSTHQSNSKVYLSLWMAETTVIDYSYDLTNANGDQDSVVFENTADKIVLENFGYGVSGDDLARIGTTETVKTENHARFTRSFSVSVDVSGTVSAKIGGGIFFKVKGTLTTSVGTTFKFEREITEVSTVIHEKEITWPSECPPGIRKTVALIEKTEEVTVPVVFTLARAEQTWTETKDLVASLSSVVVQSSECCLYEEASDQCGTEHLRMCNGESVSDDDNTNPTNTTNV